MARNRGISRCKGHRICDIAGCGNATRTDRMKPGYRRSIRLGSDLDRTEVAETGRNRDLLEAA